jgi:hypothetical protein
VGQAPTWEIVVALSSAMVGVAMISSALQGYVSLVGPINGAFAIPLRVMMFIGGILIAKPKTELLDLSYGASFLLGAAICALPMFVAWRARVAPAPAA